MDLGRNHSSFEVSSQHGKGDSLHHRLLSRNLLETFVLWLLFLNFIVSNFDLLILRSDNLAIRPGWNATKPPALIFLVMWVLVAKLLTLLCVLFIYIITWALINLSAGSPQVMGKKSLEFCKECCDYTRKQKSCFGLRFLCFSFFAMHFVVTVVL